MYVYHVHTQYLWPEGARFPGIGLMDDCESSFEFWEQTQDLYKSSIWAMAPSSLFSFWDKVLTR